MNYLNMKWKEMFKYDIKYLNMKRNIYIWNCTFKDKQ